MLTTVRRSRPKGPLRAVPGATNNRKIGGRLCYCDKYVSGVKTFSGPKEALSMYLQGTRVGGAACK